jgi:hypothetical protein
MGFGRTADTTDSRDEPVGLLQGDAEATLDSPRGLSIKSKRLIATDLERVVTLARYAVGRKDPVTGWSNTRRVRPAPRCGQVAGRRADDGVRNVDDEWNVSVDDAHRVVHSSHRARLTIDASDASSYRDNGLWLARALGAHRLNHEETLDAQRTILRASESVPGCDDDGSDGGVCHSWQRARTKPG